MKTFLNIYAIVQSLAIIWWLYIMFSAKPSWSKETNRFLSNWKEGGNIALVYFVIIAIALSVGITKTYLWLNFLEK